MVASVEQILGKIYGMNRRYIIHDKSVNYYLLDAL
jgi:hypothetical protein